MSDDREVLYAADVAKLRKTSVRAARAWLAALESEHGSNVIARDGEKLCITRRALDRFLPGVAASPLGASDSRSRALYRQVQAIARAVFDLREQVEDLRAGVQSAREALFALRGQSGA